MGGLYTVFAAAIWHEGWLPVSIPHYTDNGIPFAYPPLAFALLAVLTHGLGLPTVPVLNVLPAILACPSVLLFHGLTGVLGLRSETRILALLAFAVTPCVVFEPTMAALGLAEATGMLALTALAVSLAKVHSKTMLGWWHALAGVALALCVMAAPGSALASAILCLAFALWQIGRAKTTAARLNTARVMLVVATVGLAASVPYLYPVMLNHGPEVLMDAVGGQAEDMLDATRRVKRLLLHGDRAVVASPLGLPVAFGLLHQLLRRQWWLAIWLLLMIAIPQEGRWLVFLPTCLLAGIGLSWVLTLGREYRNMAVPVVGIAAFALLGIDHARSMWRWHTTQPRLDAFVDLATLSVDALPYNAKVITLIREDWTPLLLGRDVLNMEFGAEWEPDTLTEIRRFNQRACDCVDFDCVHVEGQRVFGYHKLYFVVSTRAAHNLPCDAGATIPNLPRPYRDDSDLEGMDVIAAVDDVILGKFKRKAVPLGEEP